MSNTSTTVVFKWHPRFPEQKMINHCFFFFIAKKNEMLIGRIFSVVSFHHMFFLNTWHLLCLSFLATHTT